MGTKLRARSSTLLHTESGSMHACGCAVHVPALQQHHSTKTVSHISGMQQQSSTQSRDECAYIRVQSSLKDGVTYDTCGSSELQHSKDYGPDRHKGRTVSLLTCSRLNSDSRASSHCNGTALGNILLVVITRTSHSHSLRSLLYITGNTRSKVILSLFKLFRRCLVCRLCYLSVILYRSAMLAHSDVRPLPVTPHSMLNRTCIYREKFNL